jgi:hypothetical protein
MRERLARLGRAGSDGAGHVVDPGLHRLGERVVRLLGVGRKHAAPNEPGDTYRAAGDQEDGSGAESNEQRRILAEALLEIQRVAQLVGGALELGALRADG